MHLQGLEARTKSVCVCRKFVRVLEMSTNLAISVCHFQCEKEASVWQSQGPAASEQGSNYLQKADTKTIESIVGRPDIMPHNRSLVVNKSAASTASLDSEKFQGHDQASC